MSNDYPTDKELETIQTWDLVKHSPAILLEYVERIWHFSDWGFKLKGTRVLRLELHTGGWSGNEEIIDALQRNFIFWSICWRKATAGGHYWFTIKLNRFKRAGK